MKKKLEKKAEKLRRKKIHEILDIVLDINTTHERKRSLTGTKPTAFFSFSGHTSGIEILIYECGWGDRYECGERIEGYVDTNGVRTLDYVLREARKEKRRLRDAGKM